MALGPTELILILVIVIVLFGVGRLARIGGELGQGVRELKKGLADDKPENSTESKS